MKMEKVSELVILVILGVLIFPGATGLGNGALHITAPVMGKLPGGVIPKLTVGFEIAVRGEVEIEKEPQPHEINDIAKMIAELLFNSSASAQGKQHFNNAKVIQTNEASHSNGKVTSIVGDDKCVEQGNFCTSLGPFCCKPLLCVNFLLVGMGICEDLHS